MARLALEIPDDQLARVVAALCALGGYGGDPDDEKARREFARRWVVRRLREDVLRVEAAQIHAAALQAAAPEPLDIA